MGSSKLRGQFYPNWGDGPPVEISQAALDDTDGLERSLQAWRGAQVALSGLYKEIGVPAFVEELSLEEQAPKIANLEGES